MGIIGGTIGDLFSERERGVPMAFYIVMAYISANTYLFIFSLLIIYDRSFYWTRHIILDNF